MSSLEGSVARAVAAIDRAVALLDRGLAEPYRVAAFTKAKPRVAAFTDDELWSMVHDRTLTELPGIGASIGALIDDAINERPSAYLAKLDAETKVASTPEGAAIMATLQGDLHVHTDWSDGGASITEMARAAAALGHRYLAVTDHSGRLTVAKGLDRSRLARQLDEHAALRAQINDEFGINVVTGVEVDINEDGSLDGDDDILAQLDVVVASVHVKMGMAPDLMTARLLRAVTNPHVDVLGHCTGRKVTGKGRSEMQADWDVVFAACAQFGTAVELNCRPERLDPPRRLLRQAEEAGCMFAIDSDAHAPGQLEWQPLGCSRAAEVGIGPNRIINSWNWEQLAGWTENPALVPADPS
jgi:putative hydrolase